MAINLEDALKQLTNNPQAQFHEGQKEAIQSVVEGKAVLCVQRTGWGKSAVYFLATRVLRDMGKGPTIIVSPLLALMRNQLESALRLGLSAETINSTNFEDWQRVEQDILDNKVDLLLLSPERLMNPQFRQNILPSLAKNCGLLVVDEAHCISDWGHDFRPDYRRIADLINQLPAGIGVLGTTATANQRVAKDVGEQLQSKDRPLFSIRGPLSRDSLRLEVVENKDPAYRLAYLAENINKLPGSGIVYTLTVGDAEKVSEYLNQSGTKALPYTGALDNELRLQAEEALKHNKIKALVATSALGMGYDKPDLGFVIHMGAPTSIIDYWQQAGRAGRDGKPAEAILLKTDHDIHVQEYFVSSGIPSKANAENVRNLLQEDVAQTTQALLPMVNLGQTRLELLLKILATEGGAERVEGGWISGGPNWSYDTERYAGLLEQRRHEHEKMLQFGENDECLQKTICRELDDQSGVDCGKCAACTSPKWNIEPGEESLKEARNFLRKDIQSLPVKKRWPKTATSKAKAIPENLRPQSVLTVSRPGDGGWDTVVEKILQAKTHSDYKEFLQWLSQQLAQYNPQWISTVPSRKRGEAMQSFAQDLAKVMNIEFVQTLERKADRRSQIDMQNSALQFENLQKAHKVVANPQSTGILIDDQVRSGWTLAMTAGQLQHEKSGPVVALALSQI